MSDSSTTPSSGESAKRTKAGSTREPPENKFQKGKVVKILRSQISAEGDINPRYLSEGNRQRLRKSLKEHGLVGHLVWNKANGHIIGGHQRLEILDSLMRAEEYELEVLMVDIPEMKQELKLNVALNNQDSQGEFNYEMLDALAVEFGFDPVEDFGFSEELVETVFPEVGELEEMEAFRLAEESGGEVEPPMARTASAEDIALMKEKKKEGREKMKELRAETGDYSTEAKGVLTLVFPKESQKRQWMEAKGMNPDGSVMHVNEFLKALGLPEENFEGLDIFNKKWKERKESREGESEEGEAPEDSSETSAEEPPPSE